MSDIGILTEQGYVAGEFGFLELTEEEKEKIAKKIQEEK